MITHGSLFSGIGGFDLAAEWAGWENKFHCEWNDFGQKVLKYYWPNAASFHDITKTDFTNYANKIDVLTGGFPCQPYSTAGKRLGKEDDRHLWPEMLRAIHEIKPRWVVGENVRGLISWNGGLVFDEVQTDLESEGYEVQPFLLPACAVNAPHRRDRVWFVAYNSDTRDESLQREWENGIYGFKTTPSPASIRQYRNDREWQDGEQCRNGRATFNQFDGNGREGIIANPDCKRSPREKYWRSKPRQYSEADSGCGWQNFPTEPPVCGANDGFPIKLDGITFPKWRNESIKAYGNAIVPQVAYQIFKAINKYENLIKTEI